MRSLLLLALLALPARAQNQNTLQSKPIPDINGGLNTYKSPNRLKDSESAVSTNILWDIDNGAVKRGGQTLYGTVPGCAAPVRSAGVLDALNGVKYFAVACGTQAFVSHGEGSFTAIGSTISASAPVSFHAGLGQLWAVDGVDTMWSTDGVSVSSYPTVPLANINGVFQNRLAIANVVNGQSTIYLSGYNNGGDFVLPSVILDTSAAIFGLNGLNDGRPITCIFDGYKDVLIIWNANEMFGLYGSGNQSFILRKLSEIGCDEQQSVQELNGNLKWLSQFGVYNYDGANTTRVSDPVKDQVIQIIKTEPGSLAVTQNAQSDWQGGNLVASGAGAPMSATISPNNVVVGTAGFTDASNSTYVLGSLNRTSTTSTTVLLAITSSTIVDGSLASASEWMANGAGGALYTLNVTNGSAYTGCGGSGTWVCPKNTNGVRAATCGGFLYPGGTNHVQGAQIMDSLRTSFVNAPVWGAFDVGDKTDATIDITGLYFSTSIYICFGGSYLLSGGACNASYSGSNPTTLETHSSGNGFNILYDASATAEAGTCSNETIANIRLSSYPSTGIYVSPVFNTGFSTPILSGFNVSQTSSTTRAITYKEADSIDQISWTTTTITPQSIPVSHQQFWRYEADFTTNSGTMTPVMGGLSSMIAETTGYFITSCLPTSPIASWGLFQANSVANGGSLTYYVSTGTNCGNAVRTNNVWTVQQNNQNVSIATATFLGVRVLFSIDAATETPTLNSITVNWNSAFGRPHMASAIFDNRYWMSFTTATNGTAFNNSVLIIDEDNRWTKFSGINASTIFVYQRVLYTGSSLGDGNVNVQNSGFTDFGSKILFDFRSPNYELGNFNEVDLYDLNVQAVSDGVATPSVFYYVDAGTTAYSAGTITLNNGSPGLIYSTARFGQGTNPTKVHTFSYEIQDTSFSPLTFYRSLIRFTPEDGP